MTPLGSHHRKDPLRHACLLPETGSLSVDQPIRNYCRRWTVFMVIWLCSPFLFTSFHSPAAPIAGLQPLWGRNHRTAPSSSTPEHVLKRFYST